MKNKERNMSHAWSGILVTAIYLQSDWEAMISRNKEWGYFAYTP
jgi:hypothetical protein